MPVNSVVNVVIGYLSASWLNVGVVIGNTNGVLFTMKHVRIVTIGCQGLGAISRCLYFGPVLRMKPE